jgi:NhaP-type Na+/H+ or K+/H+ antiporter
MHWLFRLSMIFTENRFTLFGIMLPEPSGRIGKMIESRFQIFLILLAVLAGTALLARRINTAPAILLLLAGIALAFVPGMPVLELPPELVLLLVLPPLIYSASVAMSWREFRFNLRVIFMLSVGCVIFTAFMVAAATHYLIGLPWSVGFLLGAIVAPPTWWRRWRSRAGSGCPGASLPCWRAKDLLTTPPR